MSRLRRIYKGEETWDVMYAEQEPNIFSDPAQILQDNPLKQINEIKPQDAVFNFSQSKMPKTNLNKINEKFDTMDISPKLQEENLKNNGNDMHELHFEDLSHAGINGNENDYPEIDEKDFDNFDHVYYQKSAKDTSNHSVSASVSASVSNSFYKRDKRLYNEAVRNNETISIDGKSIASKGDLISKKIKLN